MRKILFGALVTLAVVLFLTQKSCDKSETTIIEQSALIQEQLRNVGKMVVTEGHFSEIYDYKDSKAIFGDYFTSEKSALVVVNAKVSVIYDLSKLQIEVDEPNKTIKIVSIPEEEIEINPDLEYFDVQSGFFNPFNAEDFNLIKDEVVGSLRLKIDSSSLKTNARDRLLSELSKFYILTNSMGWKLEHKASEIKNYEDLNSMIF